MTLWTIPPSRTTSTVRSGRNSDSSTSRSGFVNAAEVQSSAGTTGCPQAQVGAGAARRVPRRRDEHDDENSERERDPERRVGAGARE